MTINIIADTDKENIQNYSITEKKKIQENIGLLSSTEHEEIYKILIENEKNIEFTKNNNGVFFNLSIVSNKTIYLIENFINYCLSNKKELDEYDKKINQYKIEKPPIHMKLEDLNKNIVSADDTKEIGDSSWSELVSDTKSIKRIANYIENVLDDHEKTVNKKKTTVKFNTKRKKYSKKVILDSSQGSILKKDP